MQLEMGVGTTRRCSTKQLDRARMPAPLSRSHSVRKSDSGEKRSKVEIVASRVLLLNASKKPEVSV